VVAGPCTPGVDSLSGVAGPVPRRRGRRRGPIRAPLKVEELQEIADLAATGEALGLDVRRIHPSQARKTYVCPGCQQQIAAGTGHVVVVPRDAPDLRRHWHTSCWMMRDRRRPGN
jgi:hypothetical protein